MCAEITADDNTGADRNTAKKHNQCIDDLGRGTDCPQSFFSDEVADYHTVHRVVKILENITEKEREIARLEKQMKEAARMMEYEYAAVLRDQIIELRGNGL